MIHANIYFSRENPHHTKKWFVNLEPQDSIRVFLVNKRHIDSTIDLSTHRKIEATLLIAETLNFISLDCITNKSRINSRFSWHIRRKKT
jgi:hypothetical protein